MPRRVPFVASVGLCLLACDIPRAMPKSGEGFGGSGTSGGSVPTVPIVVPNGAGSTTREGFGGAGSVADSPVDDTETGAGSGSTGGESGPADGSSSGDSSTG